MLIYSSFVAGGICLLIFFLAKENQLPLPWLGGIMAAVMILAASFIDSHNAKSDLANKINRESKSFAGNLADLKEGETYFICSKDQQPAFLCGPKRGYYDVSQIKNGSKAIPKQEGMAFSVRKDQDGLWEVVPESSNPWNNNR